MFTDNVLCLEVDAGTPQGRHTKASALNGDDVLVGIQETSTSDNPDCDCVMPSVGGEDMP